MDCWRQHASNHVPGKYEHLAVPNSGVENDLGSRSKPKRTLIYCGVLVMYAAITGLLRSGMLAKFASLSASLDSPTSSSKSETHKKERANISSLLTCRTDV